MKILIDTDTKKMLFGKEALVEAARTLIDTQEISHPSRVITPRTNHHKRKHQVSTPTIERAILSAFKNGQHAYQVYGFAKSTIQRGVNRLHARGIIRKVGSTWTLTDKGKELLSIP